MTLRNAFADLATDATLTDVKTAVEALAAQDNTVNTGLAQPLTDSQLRNTPVSVSDQTLIDLTDALYQLVSQLNVLGVARHLDGSLRVLPIGGTVTAVTAVNNLAAIGAWGAGSLVPSITNQTAQQNIINCIG